MSPSVNSRFEQAGSSTSVRIQNGEITLIVGDIELVPLNIVDGRVMEMKTDLLKLRAGSHL
jgi:hypothetical protein